MLVFGEFSSSVIIAAEDKREDFYISELHVSDKTFELRPETPVSSNILDIKTDANPLKSVPVFKKHISSMEVVVEDVAKFSVTISGFPEPTIQWFCNGKKLTPSSNHKFVYDKEEYSLIIAYSKFTDEGEYTCTASNVLGNTSCSAHLKIKPKEAVLIQQAEFKCVSRGEAPQFFKEFKSLQCLKGMLGKFEYVVTGEPMPEVLWYKAKYQLFPGVQYNLSYNSNGSGSLTIHNVQKEDSGLYSCKAFNTFGEATCTAELIVMSDTVAVEHSTQEMVQKHYEKTIRDQAVELCLFTLKSPGDTQAELQERDQLMYKIASEEKQSVPSEQTAIFKKEKISAAETAISGMKQMIMHSQTTQERLGFIEQHHEPINGLPVFKLPSTEVQSKNCLPIVAERTEIPKEAIFNIKGLPIATSKPVTAETGMPEKEDVISSPKSTTLNVVEMPKAEPRYTVHSYKVEGLQEPPKEPLFVFEVLTLHQGQIQKESKMEVCTTVSMENKKIRDEITKEIQPLDAGKESKSLKKLPKPFLASVTESHKSTLKESIFKVQKAGSQQALLMKDQLVKTALNAEEKQPLRSEHTKILIGLDCAISMTSKTEEKESLHLQIVKEQDTLPKEFYFTFEVPIEDNADLKKSPTSLHSLISEEQHLVPYECTTQLSDVKDSIKIKPTKEHVSTLHSHHIKSMCIFHKEGMLPRVKPAAHIAAGKFETAYSNAVVVEENIELLDEQSKSLEMKIESLHSEAKTHPLPQKYLPSVTQTVQKLKEKKLTIKEKEQHALITKSDDSIKQFSTTTDSMIVEDGSVAFFRAISVATCEDKYEPKLTSASVQVQEKTMSMKSTNMLEAAEEDFAVRIQEEQAVRFPLMLQEKQIIEEEHSSDIKRSEQTMLKLKKQPDQAPQSHVIQEDGALHKELAFKIKIPRTITLGIGTQFKEALKSALASEHHAISSITFGSIEEIKIKELKVQIEPKYTLHTYQITNANPPIDITLISEGEYPQKADLQKELTAAFRSIIHEQQQAFIAEQLGTIPKSFDRLETVRIGIPPSMSVFGEPPTKNLKIEEKTEDNLAIHVSKMKMQSETLIKGTKDNPIIIKGLTDTTADEDSQVIFSTVIKKVKDVNWYINGEKISSKNEFKCIQDFDTYSLIINKVQNKEHQGEYICEALNETGKSTTSANLTVVIRGGISPLYA
ncbi:titin-like [Rhinoraja longicauda]